jgi:hypothetical protein
MARVVSDAASGVNTWPSNAKKEVGCADLVLWKHKLRNTALHMASRSAVRGVPPQQALQPVIEQEVLALAAAVPEVTAAPAASSLALVPATGRVQPNGGLRWKLQQELGLGCRIGECMKLLDAVESQDFAKILLSLASSTSQVCISAFTFDRSDIVELLLIASRTGATVKVLLDEASTLRGQTRDTPSQVLQLLQNGIPVRTLCGESVLEAYREVGRSVASHIRGIHHAKAVAVDEYVVMGSCNWTTSSRSNYESGMLLRLDIEQASKYYDVYEELWQRAVPVSAEVLRKCDEQRTSRSVSSRR